MEKALSSPYVYNHNYRISEVQITGERYSLETS